MFIVCLMIMSEKLKLLVDFMLIWGRVSKSQLKKATFLKGLIKNPDKEFDALREKGYIIISTREGSCELFEIIYSPFPSEQDRISHRMRIEEEDRREAEKRRTKLRKEILP